MFGRVWSIAATRRDALQGRLCAPLQRSPNLFLLVPSPTWMPASAVPGPSRRPIPVNYVATQRISYAIADLTSTKTRIVISPQCSSILSVVRFSTVGRFRSFLGSLRIDLLISAQLASSSSTSHSGHLSRLGSWSFGPGLVPSAVVVQRQSTEVPTILRSQTGPGSQGAGISTRRTCQIR